MKKNFKIASTTIFLVIFFLSNNSFSQIHDLKFEKKAEPIEEQKIEAEIKIAKEQEDKDKMFELQNKLYSIPGSDTRPGDPYAGTFVLVNEGVPFLDSSPLGVTEISGKNGMRALATSTEQRGENAGRIWTVVAISNSTSHDTIYYYKSDDNGSSWILYGYLSLSNSDEVNYDQMDFEIIEDNSGDKYLWTVYGLTASSGKEFIGYCVLRTPTFSAGLGAIRWPGENYSNLNFGHFRPRITSDNAKYRNTAGIYICASEDSLESGYNDHDGSLKFVKCNYPYTTSPVFSNYGGLSYISYSAGLNIATDPHVDIAYYNYGGDFLVMVFSNSLNDESFIGGLIYDLNFTYQHGLGTLSGNNYAKQFCRVACSGGTNQPAISIIYRENYQNVGDWDIKNLYSTNAGSNFNILNVDVSRDQVNNPQAPDIVSRRGLNGKFSVAYTINGSSFKSVKYSNYGNNGSLWSAPQTMNHLSGALRPKPGIKYSSGDSCFCIWSGSGGDNTWASSGCNGFTNSTLNLTAMIEGFYNSSSNAQVSDTVTVYLRNAVSPYLKIDSSKDMLSSSGTAVFDFLNVSNGMNYFIVIKHRNSIETWSLAPQSFSSETMTYNFTTASNKAYGSNMKQIDAAPVRYGIYSADVNQDGNVNLTDIIIVFNGASIFTTGYKVTDVNGDNIVNLTDIVITYNNSAGFVGLMRP